MTKKQSVDNTKGKTWWVSTGDGDDTFSTMDDTQPLQEEPEEICMGSMYMAYDPGAGMYTWYVRNTDGTVSLYQPTEEDNMPEVSVLTNE